MTAQSQTNRISVYRVRKIPNGHLTITGKGLDPLWKSVEALTRFSYPWREDTPPETSFKSMWDDTHLYFFFYAEDRTIASKASASHPVVDSDRVEIFFKRDDRLDPYYSLEMDAIGRVLSTENRFYRNINMHWHWPAGHFALKAAMHHDGYTVEGSITLESLRQLQLLEGRVLKAGLFRGQYLYDQEKIKEVRWISWVKPISERPDFHVTSAFGELKLMENS